MKRFAMLAAAAALAAGFPLSAQQGVFRTGVQTVPIYTTVVDSDGRLIPDLQKQDFEVFDDGKKVDLSVFVSDVQPFSAVVMLDTSGSMTANFEFLKDAAEKFVIRLLPQDRAMVGSFSDKIVLSPSFTSDRDALVRYLHEDIDYGNPTALWEAAWVSLDALAREKNRRVVLLFTDGDDNYSHHSLKDVMRRAQAEDYMVYGIGFRNHIGRDGREVTKPDAGLKKIANETGGGYFEIGKTDELNSTFTRVADELHRQYVLGFTPSVLDGKIHQVTVTVKKPGMKARARASYVADHPR